MRHIARIALCASLLADALASAMRHAEPYIGSEAALLHWLKTTDANLTFIGDPIPGITAPEGLTPRNAQATRVVFCSVRNGNSCGGACSVYTGDGVCLLAPDTNCLSATGEVTFCAPNGCSCPCNLYSHCGTRMDNGFCWTPGTNAIYMGALFSG
ncbi:hypothetical protein GGG16DRAFT_127702 [Schizophyllum commune]